jgi:hypothetical protein
MSVYQQFLVTVQTKSATIQVTISAMDSGCAARAAQSMNPGSTVTRVEQISPP